MEKVFTHYLDYGAGSPVVLLPSFGVTSYAYDSIARKLGKKYRVIVPDLHRSSTVETKHAHTLLDYSTELHDFLSSLHLKSYYLVGLSFSGFVATDYLFQYPAEVKKVMLVSTYVPTAQRKQVTYRGGLSGYAKLLYHGMQSSAGRKVVSMWLYDGTVNYFFRHPVQLFLDSVIATRPPTHTGKMLPVPTKLLMSTKDEFMPYTRHAAETKIHNLEVETIDDYHTWFFANEDLLVQKIADYFRE